MRQTEENNSSAAALVAANLQSLLTSLSIATFHNLFSFSASAIVIEFIFLNLTGVPARAGLIAPGPGSNCNWSLKVIRHFNIIFQTQLHYWQPSPADLLL